jgi:uncharacterized protein with HEPN domain
MAKPNGRQRLAHIQEAITEIEKHTTGKDLAAFQSNRFLQLGVERCLEIISEASRHLPNDWKAAHPAIPWRQVADIGNRIRHTYHAVDSQIVWAILETELPTLKRAIEAMAQHNP